MQGFSLASALGHCLKIVPDIQESAVQFGQLSKMIFAMVMHSDAIVFLFYKTIVDWPNL